jgi:hypothetical protein
VEDWMDPPLGRQFESNRHWGDDLRDSEWSMASGCEFGSTVC